MAGRSVPMARVLIVDDHELACAGLRAILADQREFVVVGEAHSGREGLERCRALRPDIVLMDIRMPDLDGLSATRIIKDELPRIAVVICTIHATRAEVRAATAAGAAGCLLKDAGRVEIIEALRAVVRGEELPPPATPPTSPPASLDDALMTDPSDAVSPLTSRETDVLRLVVRGLTNREIAAELRIKPGTVKAHIEHVIAKLAVSSRTEAAVRAVRMGLVTRG